MNIDPAIDVIKNSFEYYCIKNNIIISDEIKKNIKGFVMAMLSDGFENHIYHILNKEFLENKIKEKISFIIEDNFQSQIYDFIEYHLEDRLSKIKITL